MANPVARINLDALQHNFQRVKQAANGRPVFSVIKANGYGHGMLQVADTLRDQSDGFAVARIEEAATLRENGFPHRLLVLGGVSHPVEVELAKKYNLDVVLHDASQIEMLASSKPIPGQALPVWLKLDTGMHRLGFSPEQVDNALEQIAAIDQLCLSGVLTHFANADDRSSNYTKQQLEQFQPFMSRANDVSLANSAAILGWPESHKGWIRPGIMLYGVSPFIDSTAADDGLKAVMTLRTRLIAVHQLKKGDAIGYGSTWICPEDMLVGVAAIGYGDGYPRHAPNGTPVLVNGKRAPIVGRVSMDMITIDLREHANASTGDTVILWGEELPAEEIAAHAGTIAYELFCRLTSRVKFRYERS